MKHADMAPGMAVYYGNKYEIDGFREDPDECRWITDGKLYFRRGSRYSSSYEAVENVSYNVRGTHIMLTREMPAHPPHHREPYTVTEFVTPGRILGEYESTAAQRRELIAEEAKRRQAERERRENADARKGNAVKRAGELGYQVRGYYSDRDKVEMDVEVLERLLDDLERLSRLSCSDPQHHRSPGLEEAATWPAGSLR